MSSIQQAPRLYTVNQAYCMFCGKHRALESGRRADLFVWKGIYTPVDETLGPKV